jgi:broad specificity phosphatase PhoE
MSTLPQRVYLVRHGATEWASDGRHTGRTDIPLSPEGEHEARSLARRLTGMDVALVLQSPLVRARITCELAGFAARSQNESDLLEWDYGAYEGLTTPQIRAQRPGWYLFRDGCPDGELPEQVGERADRVIARVRAARGDGLIFSHGHFLRVFAARWIGLPANHARFFALATAALSILGYEHDGDEPVLSLWNDRGHLREGE